jgi:2-polyprenyl-6-hydroxyphenyl methylase/3-demethylubiquinone-9 3-methyltransferase
MNRQERAATLEELMATNEIFDQVAGEWWSDSSWLSLLRTGMNEGRFAYFRRVLAERGVDPRACRALDVGCGGGFLAEEFARIGCQVTGVDLSEATLQVARAHAAQGGLQIRYLRASGDDLPFPDASFDLIICCDVLEHVPDVERVVREGARVLRPGGIYLFDTINRTLRSNLVSIKLLQEWAALIPREVHDWKMFIKPHELRQIFAKSGLVPRPVVGLQPRISPFRLGRLVWDHRKGRLSFADLGRRMDIGESGDVSVSYMGYALKPG